MYALLFSIVRITTYEITAVDSVREEHNFSLVSDAVLQGFT